MVATKEQVDSVYVNWKSDCESVISYILFLGESGLGKSMLVNSLFLTDLYPNRQIPSASGKVLCVGIEEAYFLWLF